MVPRALSNIQQKALEAYLALEPTEDTLANLTKQDPKTVTVALNWLRSYGSDRSTDLRADRTCDLIYWAIVAKQARDTLKGIRLDYVGLEATLYAEEFQ